MYMYICIMPGLPIPRQWYPPCGVVGVWYCPPPPWWGTFGSIRRGGAHALVLV